MCAGSKRKRDVDPCAQSMVVSLMRDGACPALYGMLEERVVRPLVSVITEMRVSCEGAEDGPPFFSLDLAEIGLTPHHAPYSPPGPLAECRGRGHVRCPVCWRRWNGR